MKSFRISAKIALVLGLVIGLANSQGSVRLKNNLVFIKPEQKMQIYYWAPNIFKQDVARDASVDLDEKRLQASPDFCINVGVYSFFINRTQLKDGEYSVNAMVKSVTIKNEDGETDKFYSFKLVLVNKEAEHAHVVEGNRIHFKEMNLFKKTYLVKEMYEVSLQKKEEPNIGSCGFEYFKDRKFN